MANLQKAIEKFEGRTQEIVKEFEKLKKKKVQLEEKLEKAKENPELSTISVKKLFSGNLRDNKTEYEEMLEELESIKKFIETTNGMGGVSAICKTDKELEEIAIELVNAIKAEIKTVEKKRESIEKQYDKIFSEIEKLEEERQQFVKEAYQMKELLNKIDKRTNIKHGLNTSSYVFAKGPVYHQLDQALKYAKNYNPSTSGVHYVY